MWSKPKLNIQVLTISTRGISSQLIKISVASHEKLNRKASKKILLPGWLTGWQCWRSTSQKLEMQLRNRKVSSNTSQWTAKHRRAKRQFGKVSIIEFLIILFNHGSVSQEKKTSPTDHREQTKAIRFWERIEFRYYMISLHVKKYNDLIFTMWSYT